MSTRMTRSPPTTWAVVLKWGPLPSEEESFPDDGLGDPAQCDSKTAPVTVREHKLQGVASLPVAAQKPFRLHIIGDQIPV